MNSIKRFIRDESGATAIEYGLIAALLAVAIIASLTYLSEELNLTFNHVGGKLTEARATAGAN
jgi:pilus assembly protein Flp/PilA